MNTIKRIITQNRNSLNVFNFSLDFRVSSGSCGSEFFLNCLFGAFHGSGTPSLEIFHFDGKIQGTVFFHGPHIRKRARHCKRRLRLKPVQLVRHTRMRPHNEN